MQDVKTKREARRRRILENSEKRLLKITRLKYDDDETIPEHLLSLSSSDVNTNETSIDDVDPSSSLFGNITSDNHDYFANSTVSGSTRPQSSLAKGASNNSSPKIWQKLGFKLVILAILVRIVHIFRLGYLLGETVVIPFSIFMLTQLGSCQFDQNIAGITGPVLLFLGVSPNKIRNLLICYNVVTSILIYFVVAICIFLATSWNSYSNRPSEKH